MGVKDWATTAASNTNAGGINMAEGMNPNALNDGIRQIMADIRAQEEEGGWFDWGHACTYASATSFTVPTDLTGIYRQNRRIRAVGSATGTIFGTVASSSYSSPNTTVTVLWPSGYGLSNETLAISLGPTPLGWPAVMLGHPSAVKAYVRFSPSAGTISGYYNVAAVSSSATGIWTITFDRDMGNTDYLMIGTAGNFAGNNAFYGVSMMSGSAVNTGSCTIMVSSVNETDWTPNSSGDYVAALFLGDL